MGDFKEYYKMDKDNPLSLNEISRRWVEDNQLVSYDTFYYNIDEVLLYREYTWSRQMSRRTLDEWEELKESMKDGWDPKYAIGIYFGRNGAIKVGEGNHRLGVAQELGIKKIPVTFGFMQNVYKEDDIGSKHKTREDWREVELEKVRKSELSKEEKRKQEKIRRDEYEARRGQMTEKEREGADERVGEMKDFLESLKLSNKDCNMKKVAQQNTVDIKRDELKSVVTTALTELSTKMQQATQQLTAQINKELTDIVNNLNKEVELKLQEVKSLVPVPQAAEDKLPGGDGAELDLKNVDEDELKEGIKEELEHTTDKDLAREIALDHLAEDPKYYTKLKSVMAARDLPGVVRESKINKIPLFWKKNVDYAKESPWANMDKLEKITDIVLEKIKRKK